MDQVILAYLVGINVLTFLTFVWDKSKAKRGQWRVKESVLLGLCFAGGSLGGFIAMQTVRHKTRKPLFKFGVPLLFVLNCVVFGFLL